MRVFSMLKGSARSIWMGLWCIAWATSMSRVAADSEYPIEGKSYGSGITSYTVAVPDDVYLDRVVVRYHRLPIERKAEA